MDIYEKTGVDENQKNILNFITQVISNKEEENFTISNVNLCSQFYTFIPGYISIGNMLIIANDVYWDNWKDYCDKNNVTDCQCVARLKETKSIGGKALFFKYKYNLINERIKFKKNKLINLLDEYDYINAISFPYLNSAIEKLYSNAIDGQITAEVVNKTLQQIELQEDILSSNPEIGKRSIENNVIDSLNGKRM